MNDAIEVEINLAAAREKRREEGERRKEKYPTQPSSSNSQEARMDMMMKIMEKMMERLTMENIPPPREEQEQQNGNQNFRRPLPPLRNQRMPEDEQIMPPFLDNYITMEVGEYPMENQNNHSNDIDFGIYLVEGDNFFSQEEVAPVQSVVTLSQLQFLQRHNMFPENFHQPITNSVCGGSKENLSPPVYDEQEED